MAAADLDRLKQKVLAHNPGADPGLVDRAYHMATRAHEGQIRVSGEAFIEHPIHVALILADLELDVVTVAAALLHDVVEDTAVTLEALQREFGPEVAGLVDGVTRLSRLELRTAEDEQVENLRKMFLAMARDIRVILIKLADRLHNLRTLKYLEPPAQRRIAEETIEIFAPLAHRLGIYRVKMELEDLALRYLDPDHYYQLVQLVDKRRSERESFIASFIASLRERLAAEGIEADIQGRAKHFYSIYKKMYEQGRDFEDIYDLIAIRMLVETERDCYAALGVVHSLYKPLPGRVKDFIATPKPNMYQSLHTTIVGPGGEPVEIQIRTWAMHRTAEYGIAAHWRYKEGERTGDRAFEEKLAWLRQTLEWQHDLRDPQEFMEALKVDLLVDVVYVFTPKGDIIELTAGSSPIDFAYRIHTDVGHRCVGAKVNGKIVPFDYRLNNGDIVEILTSRQSRGPSWDWLNLVKTSTARNRIRQWFKREFWQENVTRGRDLVDRELKRQGVDVDAFPAVLKGQVLEELRRKLNLGGLDDLWAGVGAGSVTPNYVAQKLREALVRQEKLERVQQAERAAPEIEVKPWSGYGKPSHGVRVKGIDNVLIRFARCCNPVPGDPIIGYVTRGRGVSVHRVDCSNVRYFGNEASRLIEVAWDTAAGDTFPVELEISAFDRPGLLSDILNGIADTRTNIISVNARADSGRTAIVDLVLEIRDLDQLKYLTEKLSRVRDVYQVSRVARHGHGRGGTAGCGR
ncbi:MAG: bifunctional (p)ppGpp synthetase/guanosine-3',5'-bis(diphosphate) 3'-pyrophosphohydrolase [bacterium]|nr:bifunctional (p)ppGpp synthetase/guanosine-3',5'-bis(diphosphate) 3'-pyrophosphohydrolase [bacterium]